MFTERKLYIFWLQDTRQKNYLHESFQAYNIAEVRQ